MKLAAKGITVTAIIGMMLLSTAFADVGSRRQSLPRSFGPFTLGMTEDAFKKVTGLAIRACHECAQGESTVDVDVEKYPGLFPAYLYGLEKYQRGLDCNFYKGKLYRIEAFPEIKEIEAAKKKYTELFGPPSKMEDWENGISWVTWENKTTAFVLAYVRKKGDVYPLTLPPGTVSLARYIDKPLRDALEAQEKKNPAVR
jgi:hypothetical protein